MQEQELAGQWWIPSDPNNIIAGILRVTKNGRITLELIGSFEESRSNRQISYPIVLGVVQGGLVTLSNCQLLRVNTSFPGYMSQSFLVDYAFRGAFFSSQETLLFHKVVLRFTYLSDWADASRFEAEEYDSNSNAERAYSIHYSQPSSNYQANISNGEISLGFGLNRSQLRMFREVNLQQTVWFTIELDNGIPYDELWSSYIQPLRNFLTLATTKTNHPTSIVVFSHHSEGTNMEPEDTPVRVIFASEDQDTSSHRLLVNSDMLFTLDDIADDFESIIVNWMQISEELDSVCNLFFGTQYNQGLYLEHEFLNMAQAVESYHRRRRNNERWSTSEFERRRDEVLSHVPQEYEEWVRERLRYANEPSLRDRLRSLYEETQSIIRPLVGRQSSFVSLVANTRNYYTHYDQGLRNRAASGNQLYGITRVLFFIMQMCFLMELGIPRDRCIELISRNSHYQFELRQGRLINT